MNNGLDSERTAFRVVPQARGPAAARVGSLVHERISTDDLALLDDERERIAGDLHEHAHQHLVELGLAVAELRRRSRRNPATQAVVDGMAQSIKALFREIRLSAWLTTAAEERGGLDASLDAIVAGFAARTGLTATYRGDTRLSAVDPDLERTLIRILQKALLNVHRHTGGNHVTVELVRDAYGFILRVADDGRAASGRDVATEAVVKLMQLRARGLGGEVEVFSAPSGTVVVEARVPAARDGAALA